MEVKKTGKIHYLEPGQIVRSGVAVAGFTTRHEGVSRPPYHSLNLGTNTLDPPANIKGNRSLLARSFGTHLERLVTVTQVHGTDLLVIDTPNADLDHFRKIECDGIVTNQPEVMIAIGVADCLPILLLDPQRRVAAALHAGWQGTAGGIAEKGVKALREMFGSEPAELLAALGPGIGACCYEVDEKVRDAFRAKDREWEAVARQTGPGKWRLDLAAANRQQLLAAGVAPERLEESGQCVACTPATFYSYRRDGGDTGRQVGFIMLRP